MMKQILSEMCLGDMTALYYISNNKGVELVLIPSKMREQLQESNGNVDSMVQIKIEGDDFPFGFANGHTMRNSETTGKFIFHSQNKEEDDSSCAIHTFLRSDKLLEAEHILLFDKHYEAAEIKTVIRNYGSSKISIEMLSSFSLSGITPFEEGEATNSLLLHRIRSKWSNEGRMETRTIEELQLEPSWSGWGAYSEKFGQVGSMPVRKYFPFAAVEDTRRKVVWAVQLAIPSSWQLEVYRRDESLCISGGIADYDFGHWCKELGSGEEFETPTAYLTVHHGKLDEACQRLVRIQKRNLDQHRVFHKLPVLFNEFCTTWGTPSEENIDKILNVLHGKDIDYFIIDAGWYADAERGWESNMGDWSISSQLFPNGIGVVADKIRNAGLKPGIWFEPEVVGVEAYVGKKNESLLKRHDNVITAGTRRFWDMRNPAVQDYLTDKIIKMLNTYRFDYIKADYNETIGVGCDGAESMGEGLRQNMLAAEAFYRKIRQETDGIVVEICSSGGHRLEPSFLGIADLASFSDAHEEKEIPVIAANLHRVILPEQSQIWAVLRKTDSLSRIVYSMTGAMYGVMCLSGDIFDLDSSQWKVVDEGIAFYRSISHIIQEGVTYFFGTSQNSYRQLKGWQGTVRYGKDKEDALLLIHIFENQERQEIYIPLINEYVIWNVYEIGNHMISVSEKVLHITADGSFEAAAIYLKKQ